MARLNTPLLLACAASIACGIDQGVDPIPPVDGESAAPILRSLELTPATADIEQGATLELTVVARDQRGSPIVPREIIYSSNFPSIATVNRSGRVAGIATGTAEIEVTVWAGYSTRSASMTVNVGQAVASPEVVLTAGVNGWQPAIAHLAAGGRVEWRTGPISWSGVPNTKIWLLDATYSVVDSVAVSNGSATRRFDTPGSIRYCSGGCWDPPDFGLIIVH